MTMIRIVLISLQLIYMLLCGSMQIEAETIEFGGTCGPFIYIPSNAMNPEVMTGVGIKNDVSNGKTYNRVILKMTTRKLPREYESIGMPWIMPSTTMTMNFDRYCEKNQVMIAVKGYTEVWESTMDLSLTFTCQKLKKTNLQNCKKIQPKSGIVRCPGNQVLNGFTSHMKLDGIRYLVEAVCCDLSADQTSYPKMDSYVTVRPSGPQFTSIGREGYVVSGWTTEYDWHNRAWLSSFILTKLPCKPKLVRHVKAVGKRSDWTCPDDSFITDVSVKGDIDFTLTCSVFENLTKESQNTVFGQPNRVVSEKQHINVMTSAEGSVIGRLMFHPRGLDYFPFTYVTYVAKFVHPYKCDN